MEKTKRYIVHDLLPLYIGHSCSDQTSKDKTACIIIDFQRFL